MPKAQVYIKRLQYKALAQSLNADQEIDYGIKM